MLAEQKKELTRGVLLMASFVVVLISLFLPIFKGTTPIHFLDQLYNSISKGSVYYIEDLKGETEQYQGMPVSVTWHADTPDQLQRLTWLLKKAGAGVSVNALEIQMTADLGTLLDTILSDADLMFHNQGEAVRNRYDSAEKLVLYDWWHILKATGKSLNREKRFNEAKFVNSVLTKAVECAYNYYGIDACDIMEQAHLVILSLAFYVIYTIWLGFAILICLKGFGLKLESH